MDHLVTSENETCSQPEGMKQNETFHQVQNQEAQLALDSNFVHFFYPRCSVNCTVQTAPLEATNTLQGAVPIQSRPDHHLSHPLDHPAARQFTGASNP